MVAVGKSKCNPHVYKECNDIKRYFVFGEGGVNFGCWYYVNSSKDHSLTEDITYSDKNLILYAPTKTVGGC